MPPQLKRALATTIAVVLSTGLTACAGSPSGDTPAEKAAISLVEALTSGDGKTACPLMTPKFLAAVKADMEDSGWDEETDGTCEGYVKLTSELVAGHGGLQVKAVTSTTTSAGTAEVVVRSKGQPDNGYVVKKVGTAWLVDEHIDSDDY
ncbi:hypothetical protein [Aeromicrobium sp. UC242_57]|uniref:hypothetical protein n=1 Tax=Aeromicrobium sp. UC242_57 TaxID=3374624 RepID=UPI00379B824E